MTVPDLGILGLAAYLGVVLVLAERARRARVDRTPADHYLAGRGLGLWVLFLTFYATAYSGNSLLGYPGEAYRRGFSWIMATGFMMSILVVFHGLVPRLHPIARREGFVTPGDWIRHRFGDAPAGRRIRVAIGVLMAIACANFLLAQLVAMGHVTSQLTGDRVPYEAAVVGFAILILVYETAGGMRAVAWTDALQGSLMLVGLGALFAWVLGEAGGIAAVTADVARLRPDAVRVPDAAECANWASSIVLLGLASAVYPQAIQRIYAARNGRTLGRALAIMSFMPLATTLVVTIVGIAAIPRFSDLGRLEADTVMPRLLEQWAATGALGAILAMTVFVGALAAIMSTADSVLLSFGSVVAGDVLGRSRTDEATTRLGKRAAAIAMGACVVLALVPRLTLWRLIELKMELLIQCVPAFLVAIHWRRLRATPVLLGIGVGTFVAVGMGLGGWTRIGGVHVGVLGFGANLAVAVLGSVLLKSRDDGDEGG